jgi:predicted nucleotidyltransferase
MEKTLKISPILAQFYDYLKVTYQNNLEQVILFGSEARGEATLESDIDILIVLKKQFNYYQEVKKVSQIISELCLKYNRLISCCFATSEQLKNDNSAFYRNIKKEGIKL